MNKSLSKYFQCNFKQIDQNTSIQLPDLSLSLSLCSAYLLYPHRNLISPEEGEPLTNGEGSVVAKELDVYTVLTFTDKQPTN